MTSAWNIRRWRFFLNDDFRDLSGSASRENKNPELKGIMTSMTQELKGLGRANKKKNWSKSLFQRTYVEIGNRLELLALLPSEAVLRN